MTAIACMVSMVSLGEGIAPFGLAIFAAVCAAKVPAGMVFLAVLFGNLVRKRKLWIP